MIHLIEIKDNNDDTLCIDEGASGTTILINTYNANPPVDCGPWVCLNKERVIKLVTFLNDWLKETK